ncbi:cell envelope biogenesis protein TolA [Bartonella sp. A05]|uniref:cell envelope biogenesis protein TolA n=1 Tax=Bartonella sp. A05 TaxID=2967261 RepID=UPI0022A9B3B1|nr:cell envelope biogenesis protein TolA [Bartonella sp. A05]MCZ2203655.1 cell envelope biogenesis protein TolA [Bartonella sp. A05]
MDKNSYHSMKGSLALSLAAHIVLIIWGGVHLTNSNIPPQQKLEAVPITLAPFEKELALQQGSSSALPNENSKPKPTTKPPEKEDVHHIGDGIVDNIAPFKPKEKPRRVEAALSTSGKKDVPETPVPPLKTKELLEEKVEVLPTEITPEIIKPEVSTLKEAVPKETTSEITKPEVGAPEASTPKISKPEVTASKEAAPKKNIPEIIKPETTTPKEIAPKEITPEIIKPEVNASKTTRNEVITPQKKPESSAPTKPVKAIPAHKPSKEVEQLEHTPLPQVKPKQDKQSVPQRAHAPEKQSEQTIEDILAMEEKNLLNRMRTQGGGAKRSDEEEALGKKKNIGDTTKMAQTLVNLAGSCIQEKLKLVAIGSNLKNRPIVRLQFSLNREGMVIGDPMIEPLSGDRSQQDIMMRQVYAAVFSCQPYANLPRDQYDLWGQGFDFNVDPLQETDL